MSKMDNLRAMREARYEQNATRTDGRPAAGRPAVGRATPPVAPPEQAPVTAAGADAAEALCGHRNMGGRSCTREQGHAAKSHRYS